MILSVDRTSSPWERVSSDPRFARNQPTPIEGEPRCSDVHDRSGHHIRKTVSHKCQLSGVKSPIELFAGRSRESRGARCAGGALQGIMAFRRTIELNQRTSEAEAPPPGTQRLGRDFFIRATGKRSFRQGLRSEKIKKTFRNRVFSWGMERDDVFNQQLTKLRRRRQGETDSAKSGSFCPKNVTIHPFWATLAPFFRGFCPPVFRRNGVAFGEKSRLGLRQECFKLRRRDRPAEQITLVTVAPEVGQQFLLFVGLYSFGDDQQAQGAGQRDDGLREGPVG
jgi:hypothetical protein